MVHLDYQLQNQWRKPSDVLCQSPIALTSVQANEVSSSHLNIYFSEVTSRQDQLIGQQFMSRGYLKLNEQTFWLERFHFHEHSEHLINHRYYDMEIHFVFKKGDEIIVVALLGDSQKTANPKFVKLFKDDWQNFDLADFFPEKSNYYSYIGSLTTPPFTQQVKWIVMEEVISVSPEDITIIKQSYPNNYRQEQPLKQREINYHITP